MPSDVASPTTERLDATIPGAFPDTSTGRTSPVATTSTATASTHQTLAQALFERRAEYTRPRNVRIKVGSWNVAAQKGTEQDIGGWFVGGKGIEPSLAGLTLTKSGADNTESVEAQEARYSKIAPSIPHGDKGSVPGGDQVGIYALGLQEVVDITSATEALRPFTDPTIAKQWKAAVQAALPAGYQLVAEQQLIGLLLLVYASPDVHPHINNVSTTSVGTGLMGYMGNKGAVTTRMVLGETTRLVFVNSHLAAGADKTALERRNWDAGQISSRTRFEPIVDSTGTSQSQGEGLGEEDFAFWFGDLNYRLEGMPGDDVRRLLTIHTKHLDHNEPVGRSSTSNDSGYASKSSSEASEDAVPLPPELDPASLQTTISCLLPHDELHQQMKAGKSFHDGWEEGPVRFLPSYKYDIGTVGVFDSSEKKRCPSWCDRILYRTRAAKQRYDAKRKEQEEARKRDEEMKAKGMDHAGEDDEVLYDYDPDTDGDNNETYDEYDENEEPEPEAVITKDGYSDEILLESYTAHMRVLSSDHKPLEATFSLKYDAVISDLKATVYAEVARELDRQENEGRPSITLVVDQSGGKETEDSFDGVDFGDVHYAQSKRRNVTIANTGRVPATFGFADRPAGEDQPKGAFPPWLSVTFDREPQKQDKSGQQRYTLEPADVLNAEIKLKIDDIDTVRPLNDGTAFLDEILVLSVENGRDHFLPIRARWEQSALARSIDKLIKIPEGGIRKLQRQKPDSSDDNAVKWSVPRELFRLTEAIEDLTERTLAEWEMTNSESETKRPPWQDNAGWPFVKGYGSSAESEDEHEDEVANAYNALDCDTHFDAAFAANTVPDKRLEIMTHMLLTFLGSLTDGIITKSLWEKLEEGLITRERSKQQLDMDDEKMWVLEILSTAPNRNASFLLILSMLQNITQQIMRASKAITKSDAPRKSTELPASPQVHVRRRTLSKNPGVAIRQLINRNYASIFTDVVFRCKEEARLKDKDKVTRRERMVKVIELFLRSGEEEQ